jgi:hypothetical protein
VTDADGFGVAYLETPITFGMFVASLAAIAEVHTSLAEGRTPVLDANTGTVVSGWPQTLAWQPYLPSAPWNPDGMGLLAELSDGPVVYEDVDADHGLVVLWHCLTCHDGSEPSPNDGAPTRRQTAEEADGHAREGHRPQTLSGWCEACLRIQELGAREAE